MRRLHPQLIQTLHQDALLAQLLGMGFAIEEIERCQVAMATSSRPYSLQEATEWLVINFMKMHSDNFL